MQTDPDTVAAAMRRYCLRIIEDRFEGGLSLIANSGLPGAPGVDYRVAPAVVDALLAQGVIYRNPYATEFAIYHHADPIIDSD